VFAKAGLQAGDIVTAVDGKPFRAIDDAADLYARAGSMKSASVAIVRAGKPQTLRVVIQ
jgi:S1-C subfamily serine protease